MWAFTSIRYQKINAVCDVCCNNNNNREVYLIEQTQAEKIVMPIRIKQKTKNLKTVI